MENFPLDKRKIIENVLKAIPYEKILIGEQEKFIGMLNEKEFTQVVNKLDQQIDTNIIKDHLQGKIQSVLESFFKIQNFDEQYLLFPSHVYITGLFNFSTIALKIKSLQYKIFQKYFNNNRGPDILYIPYSTISDETGEIKVNILGENSWEKTENSESIVLITTNLKIEDYTSEKKIRRVLKCYFPAESKLNIPDKIESLKLPVEATSQHTLYDIFHGEISYYIFTYHKKGALTFCRNPLLEIDVNDIGEGDDFLLIKLNRDEPKIKSIPPLLLWIEKFENGERMFIPYFRVGISSSSPIAGNISGSLFCTDGYVLTKMQNNFINEMFYEISQVVYKGDVNLAESLVSFRVYDIPCFGGSVFSIYVRAHIRRCVDGVISFDIPKVYRIYNKEGLTNIQNDLKIASQDLEAVIYGFQYEKLNEKEEKECGWEWFNQSPLDYIQYFENLNNFTVVYVMKPV